MFVFSRCVVCWCWFFSLCFGAHVFAVGSYFHPSLSASYFFGVCVVVYMNFLYCFRPID